MRTKRFAQMIAAAACLLPALLPALLAGCSRSHLIDTKGVNVVQFESDDKPYFHYS